MNSETQPQPSSDDASADEASELHNELRYYDQYNELMLHQPREILSVLTQVAETGDLMTVYFNEGKDFLLTTLLTADEDGVLLDKGSSAIMNDRALSAGKLFCVTRHERVKLQFLLNNLSERTWNGQKVFAAPLPETLLRLQRREYYRLNTPITRPLICQITLQRADGVSERTSVNVVDISAGGVAMLAPPDGYLFEPEMEFPDCTIELPEMGVLTTTLKVRNVYDVTLRNGSKIKRSGCQFQNLLPGAQNMVQRYIIKIERERKARDSGLA